MERTRSVGAARRGAAAGGSVDAGLRALAGAATGSGCGTGHQQERGQPAVRLRHRAQVGGTDESRTARVETGGADDRGDKHVLGLREGATENASAVRALLADLVERGLDINRSLLIVIDGAKALHKAVVEVFGARGLIQRCREHKKRNVTDALPERLRAAVRSAMNQAYATGNAGRARRLLDNLARRLEHQHPGAAASLREGLEETL